MSSDDDSSAMDTVKSTQQNGQPENLASRLREIEEIAEMLDNLKRDLSRKENLLEKAEQSLEETESILEQKMKKMAKQDGKLRKIESILRRKEEDMVLQERELQTNAALEYLSMREREESIEEQVQVLTSEEGKNTLASEIKDLKGKLTEKEDEAARLKKDLEEGGGGSGEVSGEATSEGLSIAEGALKKKMDEIKKREVNLKDMKEHLIRIEEDLRDREESIKRAEKKTKDGGKGGGGKGGAEVSAKLEEVHKMERDIRKREKDLDFLKDRLQDMEDKLKDNEASLKTREKEIEDMMTSIQSGGSGAGTAITEEEVNFKVMRQVKMKEKKIMQKAEQRIQPLLKKIEKLQRKTYEFEDLSEELEQKKIEWEMKEAEMKDRMGELEFNEQKVNKLQERVRSDRIKMDQERKKMKTALDKAKKSGGSSIEMDEEIERKNEMLKELEERLREREAFLRKKESDMRRMADKIIDEEIDMEQAVAKLADVQKVSIGVRRLDDMCYGGIPLNSNLFLYGPPFTGKDTLINLFIADGIRQGAPAIFVLTDKTPQEVRDSMKLVLPKIESYESKGLLTFIDAYSISMGFEGDEPNVIYIEKPTDLDKITEAIVEKEKTFPKDLKYHKIAFVTVSTLMIATDPMTTFRFLQGLTSRTKRAGAITLFSLEAGMHQKADVQTLKHLMNGVLEFKEEDLKTYLRIEGIGEVRTKAWVHYEHSPTMITLKGSFAVDHIK